MDKVILKVLPDFYLYIYPLFCFRDLILHNGEAFYHLTLNHFQKIIDLFNNDMAVSKQPCSGPFYIKGYWNYFKHPVYIHLYDTFQLYICRCTPTSSP